MTPRLFETYRAGRREAFKILRRKDRTMMWDAWRDANARADLPRRIVIAMEEKAVIERAAQAAKAMGAVTKRQIQDHVTEALRTLFNKRRRARGA